MILIRIKKYLKSRNFSWFHTKFHAIVIELDAV